MANQSIALQAVRPSLFQALSQAAQITQAQQQGQLAQAQLAEAQRKVAKDQRLSEALAALSANPNDQAAVSRFVASGGDISAIKGLTDFNDSQTQRAAVAAFQPAPGLGLTPERMRALALLPAPERAKAFAELATPAKAGFGQQYDASGAPIIAPSFIASEADKARQTTTATQAAQQPFEMAQLAAQGAETRRNAAYANSLPQRSAPSDYDKILAALGGPNSPKGRAFIESKAMGDGMKPPAGYVYTQDGNLSAIPGGPGAQQQDQNRANIEGKLRDDYTAQTKTFSVVRDAWNTIKTVKENDSAAGDLALIFSFMKVQDPNSAVRETEFANAQNAAGVPDRVRNAWNNALQGTRLNPAQRADFANVAKTLYEAQKQTYDRTSNQYREIAKRSGANPENVVVDFSLGPDGQSVAPAIPTVAPPGQQTLDWSTGKAR